jgi:hypothetical protein
MDNRRPPNSRATEQLDEFPSPSSRLECDSNVLQLENRTGLRGNATGSLVRKADKTVVASIRLAGGCEDIKPAQKLMVCRQGKASSSPAVSSSPTIMYCRTTTRSHVPQRLLSLRNDVGLLAEDPHARRQVGNFSAGILTIGTAWNLQKGWARRRDSDTPPVSTSMRSLLHERVAE